MAAPQPIPPWMRPLWVRLAFVVLPAAWACFELVYGQQLWALLFGATAAWGFWTLIVKYEDPQPPKG